MTQASASGIWQHNGRNQPLLQRRVQQLFGQSDGQTLNVKMKTLLFSLLTLFLTLFVIETLFYASTFCIRDNPVIPASISDATLGYRPNPKHPQHDANGFRNTHIPQKTDIITLGDSQTYGTGISPEFSWPRQLQNKAGLEIYNMAYSGYGPVHSLLLLDEALNLSPKLIIEAYYSGNDLYDAFAMVYYQGKLSELKTRDSHAIHVIQRAEREQPLKELVNSVYHYNKSVFRQKLLPLGAFLSKHSHIYRLVDVLLGRNKNEESEDIELLWNQRKRHAEKYQEDCLPLEDQNFRTIFTPKYRAAATDCRDPRIMEGLHICQKTFLKSKTRALQNGIAYLVVLIPTKELVFSKIPQDSTWKAFVHYAKLIDSEKKLWEKAKSFLRNNDILFVDSLPYLEKKVWAGVQPYPASDDGHPNAIGYEAIARCVLDKISAIMPELMKSGNTSSARLFKRNTNPHVLKSIYSKQK